MIRAAALHFRCVPCQQRVRQSGGQTRGQCSRTRSSPQVPQGCRPAGRTCKGCGGHAGAMATGCSWAQVAPRSRGQQATEEGVAPSPAVPAARQRTAASRRRPPPAPGHGPQSPAAAARARCYRSLRCEWLGFRMRGKGSRASLAPPGSEARPTPPEACGVGGGAAAAAGAPLGSHLTVAA